MNERIAKLYDQATILEDNGDYVAGELDPVKFAELIVRECANMAESFHRHQYDFTGNLELHEFIREHFGIEE